MWWILTLKPSKINNLNVLKEIPSSHDPHKPGYFSESWAAVLNESDLNILHVSTVPQPPYPLENERVVPEGSTHLGDTSCHWSGLNHLWWKKWRLYKKKKRPI